MFWIVYFCSAAIYGVIAWALIKTIFKGQSLKTLGNEKLAIVTLIAFVPFLNTILASILLVMFLWGCLFSLLKTNEPY